MHILIATPYLPWPLNAGGKVAQFSTLKCLSKDHTFTIICPVHSKNEAEGIQEIENRISNVRVKAIPFYKDRIPSNYSRLRDFLRNGLNSIRPLQDSNNSPNIEALAQYPYYPFSPLSSTFIQTLTEELESGVDLFQVEFAEMLSLAALKIPNIPKIFINHQIHWMYAQRHIKVHGFNPYSKYLTNRIFAEESIYLSGFDSIVVFSDEDAQEMSTVVDPNKIDVSPFPVPADIDILNPIPARHLPIKNFTFVGSEAHDPNRDAIEWLLSDIWPLILDSIPEAQLFVVGNWSENWCYNHQSKDIIYTGFVENITEVMQNTIQLVPVRIGSGIRTKILTAMALKVPVVSTTIGIEGIKVCDFEHALIRDTANDFALGAIALATDSKLANHIADGALEFVRNNYGAEVVRKNRNALYEKVMLKYNL
ncbi:glycosyltransferase [Chamaesiphon sp. OTE_75_metabat_556]|uniref:glycosyltransferase n=1 Tax=Chamaesiphon sp. OTE_75_metabat_556 TaxID=2964692 RepID=UPI00286A620F|nr:glycosyltransferase [Chamaesiphon sp. OTE_75_metabat_556]